jgi:hypothetical protein
VYSEFLGANELDDRPFIVMPYLKNGNARDYIQNNPECDLLQIVQAFFFILSRMSDQYISGSPHVTGSRVPSLTEGHSWRPQGCKYL